MFRSDFPKQFLLLLRVKICRDDFARVLFSIVRRTPEKIPYEIPSQHNPAGLLALCMHHWLVMTLANFLSLLKSREELGEDEREWEVARGPLN